MRTLLRILALLPLLVPAPAPAQSRRPIPYPVFETPAFTRAVARGTRTRSGLPGPAYWMNTADYTIHATLSPGTRILRGEETIRYHNASPDTLWEAAVHLRQNLNRAGVIRNRPQKLTGGIQLARVQYNGAPLVEHASARTPAPGYVIDGTVMHLTLPEPILPGASATLAFAWHFEVPEAGAPRMGQDGEVFFLGYWYPQMAVYDDLDGWKADPYMGNGEFYMDYGTYDVYLTLPEGWLVGATGVLQNPEAVLSRQTRDRLARVPASPGVVHVVTGADRGAATTHAPSGVLTWHFRADRVRDFAFGTSDRYRWDATTAAVGDRDGDGLTDSALVQAFYRPEAAAWQRSAEFARFTLEYLSDRLMPYPYPHMTTVEGVIGGGMEYPMITHIGGTRTERSLFGVTFHELGHMWFPMVVGQDEKQYTWMDEGLTSFNTNEGAAAFWHEDTWDPARQGYYRIAGTGREVESMRHGDTYPTHSPARGIASYSKPAVALHALEGLVGSDRFWTAYRTYAHRWAFKHPQPFDLFNTFEDVLGEDLDWFWTPMFYTTWTLDQAIDTVAATPEGVQVTIADRGLTPMPVLLRATYADGTTREATVPVSVWLEGRTETTVTLPAGDVVRVEIDPDRYLPDVNRANNRWTP